MTISREQTLNYLNSFFMNSEARYMCIKFDSCTETGKNQPGNNCLSSPNFEVFLHPMKKFLQVIDCTCTHFLSHCLILMVIQCSINWSKYIRLHIYYSTKLINFHVRYWFIPKILIAKYIFFRPTIDDRFGVWFRMKQNVGI